MDDPKVIFRSLIAESDQAKAAVVAMRRNWTAIKRAMYKAGVIYQRLLRDHTEWCREQAQSHGGTEAMLASIFEPLEVVGDTWRNLLNAIDKGLTEEKYAASGWSAGTYVRGRKLAAEICL